jgi:methionine-rich copper-binding protein CopC
MTHARTVGRARPDRADHAPGHASGHAPTRRSTRRSWLPAVTLLAVAVLAVIWLQRSPSGPDPTLGSAFPAPGSRLDTAPEQVQLRLPEATVADAVTTVAVIGPDDVNLARGAATTNLDGVTQRLTPPRDRGAYQVAYEVTGPDGQTMRGSYWFTYTPAAASIPGWLGFPAFLLVVGGAVVVALLQRRPRVSSAAPDPLPLTPPSAAAESSPVPAQRTRANHEGISPPGRRPRPAAQPETPSAMEPDASPDPSEPRHG